MQLISHSTSQQSGIHQTEKFEHHRFSHHLRFTHRIKYEHKEKLNAKDRTKVGFKALSRTVAVVPFLLDQKKVVHLWRQSIHGIDKISDLTIKDNFENKDKQILLEESQSLSQPLNQEFPQDQSTEEFEDEQSSDVEDCLSNDLFKIQNIAIQQKKVRFNPEIDVVTFWKYETPHQMCLKRLIKNKLDKMR